VEGSDQARLSSSVVRLYPGRTARRRRCDSDTGQSAVPRVVGGQGEGTGIVCLSNLRQITITWTMAVESDSGRLGYYVPPEAPPIDRYEGTAMQSSAADSWGKAEEGWICPAAPAVPPREQITLTFGATRFRMGTVSSAWELTGPPGYWWFLQADGSCSASSGYLCQ